MESDRLANAYPGEVISLRSEYATERGLRASLPQARYLHIATHGLVDERRGALFASLALTPPLARPSSQDDGFLQLHEIYELPLASNDLTILSACETNVGQAVEGEGVFALSRGFLTAGADRVVASQWAVDDASTAELMGAFFEAVARADQSGESPRYAVGLAAAKREVRRDPRWSHPFYWAAFVLSGRH